MIVAERGEINAEISLLEDRLLAVQRNLLHTEYADPSRRWLQQNGSGYEERLRELRAEREQERMQKG